MVLTPSSNDGVNTELSSDESNYFCFREICRIMLLRCSKFYLNYDRQLQKAYKTKGFAFKRIKSKAYVTILDISILRYYKT